MITTGPRGCCKYDVTGYNDWCGAPVIDPNDSTMRKSYCSYHYDKITRAPGERIGNLKKTG